MTEDFDPRTGDLSLLQIIRAPISSEDKAIACLARLARFDEPDLQAAAIVYALLEISNELWVKRTDHGDNP